MNFLSEIINPQYTIFLKNFRTPNSLEHYLLDNPHTIKQAIGEISLIPTESVSMCGYDYSIGFYINGKLSKIGYICFDCKTLIFKNEIFEIKPHEIKLFLKKNFIPIKEKKFEFDNRYQGIAYWKKAKAETSILNLKSILPKWVHFKGVFEIFIQLNKVQDIIETYQIADETLESLLNLFRINEFI